MKYLSDLSKLCLSPDSWAAMTAVPHRGCTNNEIIIQHEIIWRVWGDEDSPTARRQKSTLTIFPETHKVFTFRHFRAFINNVTTVQCYSLQWNNSKFMNTNEQFLKIIQIAIIRYIFEQVKKERHEPTCTLTLYILITIRLVCIFQSITIHHIHQPTIYVYLLECQSNQRNRSYTTRCMR